MIADERDEYVDWKGRKANSEEHGGIRPASLVCGNLTYFLIKTPTDFTYGYTILFNY